MHNKYIYYDLNINYCTCNLNTKTEVILLQFCALFDLNLFGSEIESTFGQGEICTLDETCKALSYAGLSPVASNAKTNASAACTVVGSSISTIDVSANFAAYLPVVAFKPFADITTHSGAAFLIAVHVYTPSAARPSCP